MRRDEDTVGTEIAMDMAAIVFVYVLNGGAVGVERLAADLGTYFGKRIAFFDTEDFYGECGLGEDGRLS